jgi:hypothetical protein
MVFALTTVLCSRFRMVLANFKADEHHKGSLPVPELVIGEPTKYYAIKSRFQSYSFPYVSESSSSTVHRHSLAAGQTAPLIQSIFVGQSPTGVCYCARLVS